MFRPPSPIRHPETILSAKSWCQGKQLSSQVGNCFGSIFEAIHPSGGGHKELPNQIDPIKQAYSTTVSSVNLSSLPADLTPDSACQRETPQRALAKDSSDSSKLLSPDFSPFSLACEKIVCLGGTESRIAFDSPSLWRFD